MGDDVFGSRAIMRHTADVKQTMYNSWTSYARVVKLSFRELRQFWRYVDDQSGGKFLNISQTDAKKGRLSKRKIGRRLPPYKPIGPLGSNGPILPVDTAHLHSRLNIDNRDLAQRWKKTNIINKGNRTY